MASVGTVKVKVEPDLDGFADVIRAEVRRIIREELKASFAEVASQLRRGTYTP